MNKFTWQKIDETGYRPSFESIPKLGLNTYNIVYNSPFGIEFHEVKPINDELFMMEDSISSEIMDSIKTFWANRELFKKLNFIWKRGILLYGPPGSGKTSTIELVKKEFKSRMEPNSLRVSQLLTHLHQKAEAVTEECNVIFEQDNGMAIYYNQNGEEVGRRPLIQSERQRTIFTEMRKEGTNE